MKALLGIIRVCVLAGTMGGSLISAQIKLPAIISDHMVIQADRKVPLRGRASAGAEITASFQGKAVVTHADANGYWRLELPPGAASDRPDALSIAEKPSLDTRSRVTIQDVLVGEVWIAGGQRNIAYGLQSMQGKEKYVAAATNSQLRFFK